MVTEKLKNIGIEILKTFSRKALLETITDLKNIIEVLLKDISGQKDQILNLKNEINRLKGQKGIPRIQPNKNQEKIDHPGKREKKKKWNKSKKKQNITITRRKRLSLNKDVLPHDAVFKGTREVIIQDIKIELDNVAFARERFYSKLEGKTYEAPLPPEYQYGEFGPGIRSLILLLHYQARMPQKLLHRTLTDFGVIISEGEIWYIIEKSSGYFSKESDASREAGIAKEGYLQIDDTSARIGGKNGFTIATCNDYFTSYETGLKKDRLSALIALAGGRELKFFINEFAIAYLFEKLPGKLASVQLKRLISDRVYTKKEFQDEILPSRQLKKYGSQTKRFIEEACAIAAYRADYLGICSSKVICDGAPQFKGLCEYLQLCWIHEVRPYEKLLPYLDDYKKLVKDFIAELWKYYGKLKDYKNNPTLQLKTELSAEFDELFSANTDFFVLNNYMNETKKKKTELLLVLEFPTIPIHNNSCELVIREKVVQRKIRNCHRGINGAKKSDIFLGLMATCRKNKLSFWKYLTDRIYKIFNFPGLDKIIEQAPLPSP